MPALCVSVSRWITAAAPRAATTGWPTTKFFPRATHRCTGKGAGQTCHVERWNNTLRQRLGRFVRRTLSFSKCERMHELALRVFIHEYNQQPVS